MTALGVLVLGGTGAAAWFLRPEGAVDWLKEVKPFRYGPSASRTGSMFVPTAAADKPCPLLILLDPTHHGAKMCARFAKHCEQHGWIAVSGDVLGAGSQPSDPAEVALLGEYARATAAVDASRPVRRGYDMAGEAACRLALVQPDLFSAAILDSTTAHAWRDVGALARQDVAFFLFTRSADPTREQMMTMKDEMEQKGLRVSWSEQPGTHPGDGAGRDGPGVRLAGRAAGVARAVAASARRANVASARGDATTASFSARASRFSASSSRSAAPVAAHRRVARTSSGPRPRV